MPFIRYARDKRGYETTVVLHAYRSAQGSQRSRVLYVFRSPSNITVGRRALEEEVMEALEHTHPDLTFDWSALQREIGGERVEYREREPRRPPPQWRSEARRAPVPETPPPTVEDQSPLGRAIGAANAARLRTQYNELLQRIVRRARTPEDRDRLTERATRLNPDEWPEEAAIRAGVQTVEAEWAAIATELPQRRRGRRGGRQRRETWPGQTVAPEGEPSSENPHPQSPSGIMLEQGEIDAADNTGVMAGEDHGPDDPGDRGRRGSGDDSDLSADDTSASGPTARLHEDG